MDNNYRYSGNRAGAKASGFFVGGTSFLISAMSVIFFVVAPEGAPRNMRRLREQKGWSQEQYAFEAGIHRTYVSDIERGARNPTIAVVEKLAIPLNVTAAELLT